MSTTTEALALPKPEELNMIANGICEVAGAVEEIRTGLRAITNASTIPWADYVEEVATRALRGDDAPAAPEVEVPEVDPATAWRLHRFADDVKGTAEKLLEDAREIDRLAHVLASMSDPDNTAQSVEDLAAFDRRMVGFFERKAEWHHRRSEAA